MKTFRRFGRFQTALALAVLAFGLVVTPSASYAKPGHKLEKSKLAGTKDLPKLKTVGKINTDGSLTKTQGQLGSIELNVDTVDEGAQVSLFTYGTDITVKGAFGNLFTLTDEQAPFQLTYVAVLLAETTDGVGFEANQAIGITVFADASGSHDINKAVPVFNGTVPDIGADLGFLAFQLPDPIVVKQGDIYIIVTDLGTDDEDTAIPVVLEENGGSGSHAAFVSLGTGAPNPLVQSGYFNIFENNDISGNCVVRGIGDPATADQLVSGDGEPTDNALAMPTNLTAVGTSPVTLSWTAPNLPGPPTPTPVSESEPNDAPASAQVIQPNTDVSGAAKSGDNGAPGGFGADDVEDWFKFTLENATAVSIDLTDFGNTDFDLLLYGVDGPFDSDSAVAVSGGGAGEEEHIELGNLAAGTYVIAVSAFDPDVASNTQYHLVLVAAPKVSRYNIYQGSSDGFPVGETGFFGTAPGDATSFIVKETSLGVYFRVTAVIGGAQSGASNSASGTPCEGGPTIGSVKVKRSGPGALTFKNVTGASNGLRILINGVGFSKAPKIKMNGATIKQKGPLANGQTVGQACPPGTTITILTDAGCTTVTAP